MKYVHTMIYFQNVCRCTNSKGNGRMPIFPMIYLTNFSWVKGVNKIVHVNNYGPLLELFTTYKKTITCLLDLSWLVFYSSLNNMRTLFFIGFWWQRAVVLLIVCWTNVSSWKIQPRCSSNIVVVILFSCTSTFWNYYG